MSPKARVLFRVLIISFYTQTQGASLLERSYGYMKSLGSTYAPGVVSVAGCVAERDVVRCAKEKAGKMLDLWEREVDDQRRSWATAADAEVRAADARGGRGAAEGAGQRPSRIGGELENSLRALADLLQNSLSRAMARKKGGNIDTITISSSPHEKKKKKKKKPVAVVHASPQMMMMLKKMKRHNKTERRSLHDTRHLPVEWVVGQDTHAKSSPLQTSARVANSAWTPRAIPLSHYTAEGNGTSAESITDSNVEARAFDDASTRLMELDGRISEDEGRKVGEERGKKKKKKKAILKLLLLGAVLKAKIGLLLQILSAKLQVKFFLIALAGLAINVARFWLDLKKGGQPQKVIYYEHAQHQHHYEHDDDESWGGGGGGGYWSRSLDGLQEDQDHEHAPSPYRAYPLVPPRRDDSDDSLGI